MTFKSSNIRSLGGNDYAVAGDLTVRGVTKSITLTVEDVSKPIIDPWGNSRLGLSCVAKINRKEFGLLWDTLLEAGGAVLGDEVTITLDVEFTKG
jgi:polyisoprenoid-binding protein YceI